MNADYIYKIALELADMPYKSILINGAWGIGKSYEINRAFAKNDDVCYISLFGLKDSRQLYHDILIRLIANNKKSEIMLDKGNKILNGLLTFCGKENMLNIITEDELVIAKLNSLSDERKKTILIFDDMERIGLSFNIEEFFGIIERFRGYLNIKIIIIVNLNEMSDNNKHLYEKYNEKIIDKIYHINELSSNIKWTELNIDKEYIKGFIEKHKIQNIRTLQKAQNFYDDVSFHVKLSDRKFMEEIREICYAIVLEDVDKLYEELPEEYKNDKKNIPFYNTLYSDFVHRIKIRYLQQIISNENFVKYLYDYYKNEIDLNPDTTGMYYQLYMDAGEKAYYYKSDTELKDILPILQERLKKSCKLTEIISITDTMVIWMEVLGINTDEVITIFDEKIEKAIDQQLKSGETYFSYSEAVHIESKIIKSRYNEIYLQSKNKIINYYIEGIINSMKKKQFDTANTLVLKFKDFSEFEYGKIIRNNISKFLIEEIFPINSVERNQYYVSFVIIKMMKKYINEDLCKYIDFLKNKYEDDKMFIHRMKNLLKDEE